MEKITLYGYAKVNLAIDVLGKRADGYHEVHMVMAQVDLWDRVTLSWVEEEQNTTGEEAIAAENGQSVVEGLRICLSTDRDQLPNDAGNLAYRAAERMAEHCGEQKKGVLSIQIEKNIPIAAGLAGGSADAAAVLHGLNVIWGLNLQLHELQTIGVTLGADIPFCLAGQAALNPDLGLQEAQGAATWAVASGIGEKLEPLPGLACWVLLSKPPIALSTAEVYKGLRLSEITERPNIAELVAGVAENDWWKVTKNMCNLLETYSLKEYPNIMYTKDKMKASGNPLKVLMSGSGPTVFGIYGTREEAQEAFDQMKLLHAETFLVKMR